MNLRRNKLTYYEGNNEYKGLGILRYCVLCGSHRPAMGGSMQNVLNGRHFCCDKHPKPKDLKCQPVPPVTKDVTKAGPAQQEPQSGTQSTKTKTNQESVSDAMALVKAAMMALAAPLVEDPEKNGKKVIQVITTGTTSGNE